MARTSLLAALLLPAALLGPGCRRGPGDAPPPAALPPAVEAVEARSGTLPLSERLSGVLAARNQVEVRSEIEAPIVAVLVRSGEAVARGQLLVRLRDDALREQLRQAEAAVAAARAAEAAARARAGEVEGQAARMRALAAEGLVSVGDLETREAQLAAARASGDQEAARVAQALASVDERRAALARAEVRSPVAGHVGERNAEPGQLAEPGTVLFVVGDLDRLIAGVSLTEAMLAHLAPGQPVEVRAASLGGEPLRATLSRVSPFIGRGSFATVAEIDLPDHGGRLRPGMLVAVEVFHGESGAATLVPISALWEDPATGRQGVYVAALGDDAQAAEPAGARPVAFRPVEVIGEARAVAGVRGVAPGDWVVTVGQHLLARDAATAARVRPTTWEQVLELHGLRREDLLRGFLAEQQRLAAESGGEAPVPVFAGGGGT